jgi:hypothetical protein
MTLVWLFAVAACTSTAWAFAQWQHGRALAKRLEEMRAALEGGAEQLRRSREDVYVLEALMIERGYIARGEVDGARERLLDKPMGQLQLAPLEPRGSVH